jgi:hypothetical protein
MKLLSGPAARPGSRRALLMLAAGSAVTAILWLLADPPATAELAAAERPTSQVAGTQHGRQFAFVPRKAVNVVTNLFGGHSWHVAPPPPPPVVREPPAPTAPPLPFTLLGSYSSSGAVPVYFLVKGDSVYDVHVGDVIDNVYSVDGLSNGRLNFTYLPMKISQSLAVGSTP